MPVEITVLAYVAAANKEGKTNEEAITEYAAEYEQKAIAALELQGMRERLTPDYLRTYRMRDPQTAIQTVGVIGDDLRDYIIQDMARMNVHQHFRNAGLEAELVDTPFEYSVGQLGRYEGIQYNVGQMWKGLTEDPTGNLHVQQLKRAGRIDPDAVVETTAMQSARNLNFLFRLVFNPTMETMEATADTIDYAITVIQHLL